LYGRGHRDAHRRHAGGRVAEVPHVGLPGDRRERAELGRERERQPHHAVRPHAAVLHDGEDLVLPPPAAEAVAAVGERVLVEGAGEPYRGRRRQRRGDERRQAQRGGGERERAERAHQRPDRREPRGAPRQVLGVVPHPRGAGDPRQEHHAGEQHAELVAEPPARAGRRGGGRPTTRRARRRAPR
jgi:hypothetical protein